MATIGDIGLAEPTASAAGSTITARLAAVQITRNSTVQSQEILCIGDPDSTTSSAIAKVSNAVIPSTGWGLGVRVIGGASSGVDFPVRVIGNSTASDYVPVRLVDSSGTGFLAPGNEYTAGSTYSSHAGPTLAYDNSSNNTYRTVGLSTPLPIQMRRPGRLSKYSTVVSTASTAFYPVVSTLTAACVVRAYSITSTAVAALAVTFHDSTTNQPIWGLQLGSGSSGVTGANLAMPDGIFQTASTGPLNVRLGTTGVEVVFAIAYHEE